MRKVLIHLDTILDIRLVAIDKVNPEAIPEALQTYKSRLVDDFDYTDCKHEKVMELLESPGELYPLANETAIPIYVNSVLTDLKKEGLDLEQEIMINTYPVTLASEEKEELAEVLGELFEGNINIACIPYHNYVSIIEDITLLVCYDLTWESSLVSLFAKHPLPNLTVFAARVIPKEGYEAFKKEENKDNVFPRMEIAHKPLFSLNFLPIQMFCAMTGKDLERIVEWMIEGAEGASFDPRQTETQQSG